MSVSVDKWRGEIGNFNNRIASNLLFCTYHFNNIYKIILPVFCFLFIVTVCELFRKYLNTLLKQNKFQKLHLEFHKLLSCLYLAILSNYITWCISIILLSSDIEISLGPKSSSRECLICHWDLNGIFLNWDPWKGQQPLQGMKLKEKESLWSREVWEPAVKALNGVRSKSPENIWLFDGSRIDLKWTFAT